jgi:pyruvate dehydrogenase E1 component alpha subunit
VLAVYDAVTDALALARSGGGATVIEAMTYRMGPHSTSDDPGRYRALADEHAWQKRDPLARAEEQLRLLGADDTFFQQLSTRVRAEVERVRRGTIALTRRPTSEMFDFVYADPPAVFAEQRDRAIAEVDNG